MTVRFASHINLFTYPKAFEELVKAEPGLFVDYPWSAKTRVHTDNNAWTDGIRDCNAGGMVNPLRAMLYHFQSRTHWWKDDGSLLPREVFEEAEEMNFPANIYPQDYITALNQDYKDLKAGHPKLRGLITGGYNYIASTNLKNLLTKLYTQFKIPFSTLWDGDGAKSIHYSLPKDTWTLMSPIFGWDPAYKGHGTPLQKLRWAFSKIAIDPGDTLSVDGTPIPPETLAQANLLKTGDQAS